MQHVFQVGGCHGNLRPGTMPSSSGGNLIMRSRIRAGLAAAAVIVTLTFGVVACQPAASPSDSAPVESMTEPSGEPSASPS
jgi:hypothetical protein